MALAAEYKEDIQNRAAKPLLYVGIVSIIMLFAGFTSAYIVRQTQGNWMSFELPSVFYVSTAIILLSSLSLFFASFSIKRNNTLGLKIGLAITFLLGIGFIFSQYNAWQELVKMGVFFTGEKSNASGSFLYIITGLHLVHLLGGIVALAVTFIKSLLEKYSSENLLGVELCSIYWHFLGILWVYLLLFLQFID